MNLKDNLKKIRKDNNLSQEDLAEKLGVTRQAVSKWEQGLAYPEMDKVLQLCNMFNLNIDEILNQDIRTVEKNKQSKRIANKYVDDFLSFISKTVNMFSSMKFKDKIKCLFEQFIIIIVLIIIGAILNNILGIVFNKIFSFLGEEAFSIIYHMFEGVFYLIYCVCAIIVILHIFKTRYLDYYVVVDKEEPKGEKEDEESDEDKKFVARKEEKVIIRDPNHSGYGFINGIAKVLLFIVKVIVFFIGLNFCASLVGFAILLALSFLFVKTGLLFVGGLLGCLCAIAINLIILYCIFYFISNQSINTKLVFITIIVSLILGGVSCGLIAGEFKDFRVVTDVNSEYLVTTSETIEMDKNYVIPQYFVEYVESTDKDLKVEYKHTSYCNINSHKFNNELYFEHDCGDSQIIKNIIKDLEHKVFVVPDTIKVTIYTTKDNIKILKANTEKYYKDSDKAELNDMYKRINELEIEVDEKENRIFELEGELNSLKNQHEIE